MGSDKRLMRMYLRSGPVAMGHGHGNPVGGGAGVPLRVPMSQCPIASCPGLVESEPER